MRRIIQSFLDWYESLHNIIQAAIALGLLAVVGWLNYYTGAELSFSIFYLVPLALVSWSSGRRMGFLFAMLSAFVWYGAEITTDKIYSIREIGYWNTAVRWAFFSVVTYLISAVRNELRTAERLSQTDFLTGAVNRRHFAGVAENELERVHRYKRPLSLAYLDLDNFKSVNDKLGHEVGDELLKTIVALLRDNLRRPDVVARIGGDEFLLLMPETGSEAAHSVIERILSRTREAMEAKNLPVTLSIGVVTTEERIPLAELVSAADSQMYLSKDGGRNQAHYADLPAMEEPGS